MKILDIYMNLKEENPHFVIIIKVGSFYHVYTDDVYLFNNFFDYKIFNYAYTLRVGFPINNIKNVINMLDKEKINYIIVNGNSEEIVNYRMSELKHLELIKNSKKKYFIKNRIDKLHHNLLSIVEKSNIEDILERIETLL